jgi:hypothetical protein
VDEYAAAFARLEDVMRHHDERVVRRLTAVHDQPPDPDPIARRDRLGVDDLWRGLTA